MKSKKVALIVLLVTAIALFFMFDLNEWLTLNGLKEGQGRFQIWYQASPFITISVFFIIYIVVTALSLPGAAVMTLAAGYLFGLTVGTLIVSFASSIGALLAFWVSRYLLRDWVQHQFGNRMQTLNKGIEREGLFYLFTLRLVPLIPFFMINLLMGITLMPAWTFYWVSQVGMLAGTLVYVNAGTQLATIESLGSILSFKLLCSFALLGLFPLIAKKLIDWIRSRRVYALWTKPKSFDRNLLVIGAGAGGLVSAYIAAAVKAKVTLIESHKMGGDCLNFGCVPSKALIKSAKVAYSMQQAQNYGLDVKAPSWNLKTLMGRINEIIKTIEPHDSVERYTELGVEVIQGYASFIDPWTLNIQHSDGSAKKLSAPNIIIATGASPFVPPIPGLEEMGYLTSDSLWEHLSHRETLLKRLVILGGGPIGCELAQCFARLGIEVIQVEMGNRLLVREDPEISQWAHEALSAAGVQVLIEQKAVRCEFQHGFKVLVVEYQGNEIPLEFDEILLAVGRQPRIQGYGLETLGIDTQRRLETNVYLETLFPHIYAVGDVASPLQFTHTAAHQAGYAVANALFGRFKRFKIDERVIPWVTYMDPEIARVGLNEQEAKAQNLSFEVTRYDLDELDRAIVESEATGFVKVLTTKGRDEILGVTILGSHAGDWLPEFVLAMQYRIGLSKVLRTVHAYPTWAEANKYVAGVWKREHTPVFILSWLEKYHRWCRKARE